MCLRTPEITELVQDSSESYTLVKNKWRLHLAWIAWLTCVVELMYVHSNVTGIRWAENLGYLNFSLIIRLFCVLGQSGLQHTRVVKGRTLHLHE